MTTIETDEEYKMRTETEDEDFLGGNVPLTKADSANLFHGRP